MTNNGVYGNDGDTVATKSLVLVVSKVNLRDACAVVAVVLGLVCPAPQLSNTHGRFGGIDEGSNAMAAAHQQSALAGLGISVGGFNLGLGLTRSGGDPNGLSMAQLVQLKGWMST